METAKLILDFITVLVWPILVLFVVCLFRSKIEMIFDKITSATLPGGVKLDFGKEISKAKAISKAAKPIEPTNQQIQRPLIALTAVNARLVELKLRPSPSGWDFTYYRRIADSDPTLALAGVRIELEIAVKNLVVGFELQFRDKDSIGMLLRRLKEASAITEDQYLLAKNIVRLCNAAVHGQAVTKDEAQDVIDVLDVLATQYVEWLSWGFPNK
jgi:Domain of unknown function (DUF4145)